MDSSDIKEKKSMRDKVLTGIGAAVSLYAILYITHIISYIGITIDIQMFLASMLMIALSFVFIYYRAKGGYKSSSRIPWYDYLFIIGSLVSMGYIVFNFDAVFAQEAIGSASLLQSIFFCIAAVCILEGTRRTVGLPIVVIALFFIFQVFFCNYLPGLLHGRGYGLDRVAYELYIASDGIFSTPIKVVCTIVFAFLVFGQFLTTSGASDTFVNLPMALLGWVRGGPAKVAVMGSALMAMLSGSAIANVSSIGQITIPLMKKTGYNKDFAGAVEAVASTGGQLTPPVMGGAIFLMSEWLNIPYITLCFYAIFPAILYYLNVFMVVDLEAARRGLIGLPRESLPSIKPIMKKGWIHFMPIILLVYLLAVLKITPEIAALYSVGLLIIISMSNKKTFPTPGKIVNALHGSLKQSLMVLMAVGSAGIIVGTLAVSGLALKMGSAFIGLSHGNLAIMMVLAAIAAFIMGMGMHPVVIYIILAVTLAPSLIVAGVPDVAAHFFVMVCAMLSLITPPVAMAVFAAVPISGGTVMKTGFHATRLGMVIYMLPFWFVYRPAIMMLGTPMEIFKSVATAVVAVIAISSGSVGYALTKLGWTERILLIIGALLLIAPSWWSDVVGFTIIGLIATWQVLVKSRRRSLDAQLPKDIQG